MQQRRGVVVAILISYLLLLLFGYICYILIIIRIH